MDGVPVSELVNREELEARLIRAVSRTQQAELARLLEALGDPPNLERLTVDDFWNDYSQAFRAALIPEMTTVYLEQAGALLGEISIGVSWDLINTAASEWARQYTFDLVTQLTEVTRSGLQRTIPAYFEEGLNLSQLKQRLAEWFAPRRAELIGITEITRAATEGERGLVELLLQENPDVAMAPFWVTNRDEAVCVLCSPRDGKEITDGKFPPLHPKCRCWVRWVLRSLMA